MYDTTERAGIEEQYQTAGNTSDLTVEADRRGAGDILIAAGLSSSLLGQALIRLRGEWDSADKPRKATEAEIERAAAENPKKGKPDIHRARTVALVGYATALRKRAEAMPGRAAVLEMLGAWAQERGVDPDLLSPALYHFINPTCPVCDGRGSRRLPDAPVLGKTCHHCNGSGKWPQPLGAARVDGYMRDCVAKAKASMGRKLRGV